MAWIDDIDLLNNAATGGNWTANGFDTPTLNNSSSTTPIYLEGSACMWWPLKKGTTNGYVYTSTIGGTPTLTGRVVVGFLNYPFADIDLIPINSIFMRLSSSTGYTTNYRQWDASAQLLSPENIPISGHTPVIGFEDAGTESGTFNGNAEAVGWVATTGNDADGKQGGFDWFFIVGWVGAHSATYTNTYFSGLYDEYYDNEGSGLPGQTSRPIAVLSQSGSFFQSNIRFQLGDGTSDTTNIVVSETGKTIFFNNLHINHELGYIFVNPGIYTLSLTLTDCVHFWNDQSSTAEVFDGATNADVFKLSGCSFTSGGNVTLPAHDTTTTTFVTGCKFDNCGPVDVGDITFIGNTVSNATSGILMSDTGHRVADSSILNNTYGMEFDAGGTYTLDGDTFSGNTYDIYLSITTSTADSYVGTGMINLNMNTETGVGQSFTGDGNELVNAKWDVKVGLGSPTGDITVKVYAHSGTFGTSSVPTGTALATSSAISATTLTGSYVEYTFTFPSPITLTNGTKYVVTIEHTGDASNYIAVHQDSSAPTHGGNKSETTGGAWSAAAGTDLPFEVNTSSGGSGTLTINSTNGANPSTTYSPGGGTIIINNAVNLTVHVQTLAEGTDVQNARVRLMKVSDDSVVLEGLTDVNGDLTDSINYAADIAVYGWVRKSTSSPLYRQAALSGTITTAGYNATANMALDE